MTLLKTCSSNHSPLHTPSSMPSFYSLPEVFYIFLFTLQTWNFTYQMIIIHKHVTICVVTSLPLQGCSWQIPLLFSVLCISIIFIQIDGLTYKFVIAKEFPSFDFIQHATLSSLVTKLEASSDFEGHSKHMSSWIL